MTTITSSLALIIIRIFHTVVLQLCLLLSLQEIISKYSTRYGNINSSGNTHLLLVVVEGKEVFLRGIDSDTVDVMSFLSPCGQQQQQQQQQPQQQHSSHPHHHHNQLGQQHAHGDGTMEHHQTVTNRRRKLAHHTREERRHKIISTPNSRLEFSNFNALLQDMEKFDSFDAFLDYEIAHTANSSSSIDTTDITSSSQKQRHHTNTINHALPYAIFDYRNASSSVHFHQSTNANRARLTWCEYENHFFKQHNPNSNSPRADPSGNPSTNTNNDTPSSTTSTTRPNNNESNMFFWNSLRNRRIAFIGESVARFQYLDLVYFLLHKRWNGDGDEPSITNEEDEEAERKRQHSLVNIHSLNNNWTLFNTITSTELLKDHELCECYRPPTTSLPPHVFDVVENRRFHLQELNVTIWYFLWYGQHSRPHGSFNIIEDFDSVSLSCMPSTCKISNDPSTLTMLHNMSDAMEYSHRYTKKKQQEKSYQEDVQDVLQGWSVDTTATFVDLFVRTHNPDVVMLASGFHGQFNGKTPFSHQETSTMAKYVESWRTDTTRNIQTKLVFRSTTPTLNNDINMLHIHYPEFDIEAIEYAEKHGIWHYWNVSADVIEKLYWVYHRLETPYVYFSENNEKEREMKSRGFYVDNFHFAPWVYKEMNKDFIMKFIHNIHP